MYQSCAFQIFFESAQLKSRAESGQLNSTQLTGKCSSDSNQVRLKLQSRQLNSTQLTGKCSSDSTQFRLKLQSRQLKSTQLKISLRFKINEKYSIHDDDDKKGRQMTKAVGEPLNPTHDDE